MLEGLLDANDLYYFPNIQLESSSAYGSASFVPYHYTPNYISSLTDCTSYDNISLWHYRLGHIIFHTIKIALNMCDIKVHNKSCEFAIILGITFSFDCFPIYMYNILFDLSCDCILLYYVNLFALLL